MERNVNVDASPPLREYVGFIWIGEQPGIRLRLLATSGEEAKARVVEEYGDGHVTSIWNEEDAARPR
jgi:hypothetical protein